MVIIVNPVAGRGRALAEAARVESLLRGRGVWHATRRTEFAGHATTLAREAADGNEDIVVVGGDGTLREAMMGVTGTRRTLYVAPCGTGNDFAKVMRLPKDAVAALEAQLDGEDTRFDVGLLNDGAFLNVAGAGFDVEVLRQARRFPGGGLKPYLMGVCAAVRRFRPLDVTLTLDGETAQKKLTILSIANGQYIGGGMRVAPEADARDGLFDVVMVRAVKRWQIPFLFTTFLPGWFTRLPITTVRRCREVAVRASGLTVNADGELLDMDEARFKVAPGGVNMRVPRAAMTRDASQSAAQ